MIVSKLLFVLREIYWFFSGSLKVLKTKQLDFCSVTSHLRSFAFNLTRGCGVIRFMHEMLSLCRLMSLPSLLKVIRVWLWRCDSEYKLLSVLIYLKFVFPVWWSRRWVGTWNKINQFLSFFLYSWFIFLSHFHCNSYFNVGDHDPVVKASFQNHCFLFLVTARLWEMFSSIQKLTQLL